MSKKDTRLNQIISFLKEKGWIHIRALPPLLGVSEMTVRRDAVELEKKQIARNINGILMYNVKENGWRSKKEYNVSDEANVQNEAKTKIGRFAASLIGEGDSIILDTGSTTEKIIPCIPSDLSFKALCYNTNILIQLLLYPNVELFFAGGSYHQNAQMFESPEGINFIKVMRANKVFVSAAGVHAHLGLTCLNNYEIPTKLAILASAAEHILVVDSSKFGVVCSYYFCDLSGIDTIITDSGLAEEWISLLNEQGIKLYLV